MAIGCYKEPYLPASFKGISFKAEEADSEHGRRGAEGEFVFGEETGYADMGRKIRTYSLRGRFDGNDHVARAAALIAVCEATGPGVLVHPTRGIILAAACRRLKVTDKIEDAQGVTYVDLDFVEANQWVNGSGFTSLTIGLPFKDVINAARDAFNMFYKMDAIQLFRRIAVVASAQAQVATIRDKYMAATVGKSDKASRNRIVYDLSAVAGVQSRAEDTTTMERALALGMTAVANETKAQDKFQTFRDLANSAALTSGLMAPASYAENAVYSLVRVSAAAYMSDGVLESTDYRAGQIFEYADVIDAVLAQEMSYARATCQNALYLELSKFRNEASTKLSDKAYNSPGIVEYEFGGQTHPLAAAYAIYGDAKRHRELELPNNVGRFGRIASPVAGVKA